MPRSPGPTVGEQIAESLHARGARAAAVERAVEMLALVRIPRRSAAPTLPTSSQAACASA
jgi:ABC-type glutathione transport system ATPase component